MTLRLPQRLAPRLSDKILKSLFFAWLWVSPFYYMDVLFTGQWDLDVEQAILQKSIRYFPAIVFGTYFTLSRFYWKPALLCYFCLCLIPFELLRHGVSNSLIVILNFAAYSSLICARSRLNENDYQKIISIVAYTSSLVALIGIYEFLYLSDFLERYFREDVSRIVSTLFNPNNLALYLGAGCIAIMSLPRHLFLRASLVAINAVAIYLTGSRTAWVGITVASLFFLAIKFRERFAKKGKIRFKPKTAFILLLSTLALSLVILTLPVNDTLSPSSMITAESLKFSELRGFDVETLLLRWDQTKDLIGEITALDILFPLVSQKVLNYGLVDNGYLTLLVHLGFIFVLVYAITLVTYLDFGSAGGGGLKCRERQFMLIVIFYLVSLTTTNVQIIFPNNQTFFLAVSYFIKYRR